MGPLVDMALGLHPAMVLTAFLATASIFACFSGAGMSLFVLIPVPIYCNLLLLKAPTQYPYTIVQHFTCRQGALFCVQKALGFSHLEPTVMSLQLSLQAKETAA